MIRLDVSKCSGCRRCEVRCSFDHSGKVGRNGSRIKVVKIEDRGIDVPVVCQQCRERYCTKCPESAITVGSFGEIVVSPTLCTACGVCEVRCPIGAIELFNGIPYACDLCGGDPRCVGACNLGAITWEREAKGVVSLEEFRKKTRGASPEVKRVCFAQAAAEQMRDRWFERRRK